MSQRLRKKYIPKYTLNNKQISLTITTFRKDSK